MKIKSYEALKHNIGPFSIKFSPKKVDIEKYPHVINSKNRGKKDTRKYALDFAPGHRILVR